MLEKAGLAPDAASSRFDGSRSDLTAAGAVEGEGVDGEEWEEDVEACEEEEEEEYANTDTQMVLHGGGPEDPDNNGNGKDCIIVAGRNGP